MKKYLIEGDHLPSPIELTLSMDSGGNEIALGKMLYEDYEFKFVGHVFVFKLDELHGDRQPDFSLHDGDTMIAIYWDSAALTKANNPIVLRYSYDEESGRRLYLDHLDRGSRIQAKEMLHKLGEFEKILQFQQEHRGGRRKGQRTEKTRRKYSRMLMLRYSSHWRLRTDKEFIEAYPEYSFSSLQRAKKWDHEGRP